MAVPATAELCDAHAALLASGELRVLQPMFKAYGRRGAFAGAVVTLKLFEDNVLVREMLTVPGAGKVLVLAQNQGWAGVVVNGCVRDVDEIDACDLGVRALGSHPVKSGKKGTGEKHAAVHIGGAAIRDGEWLYADSDGILVSSSELSL
ncbi:unnamed protein product [Spirodela intermedia]|uniref:4-hydroxy-4-methyl-2-oxoglutarate aldolase n=1 Tax=Spirodela intermedia TaxID=51605 RepID=A0A7I8JMV4_SPIIN|nr:unnamed protein product [Spirodela intermedia]CAA6670792.1 unnamed protein product [Spirodela intermedia]